jgi:transketolase
MSNVHLAAGLFSNDVKQEPIRAGFGRGLVMAAEKDANIVGACADLTDSTHMREVAKACRDRCTEVGIDEMNLVSVGSGLASQGKIPFVSSYAAFAPGRCWEQIRTTICLNDQPVRIIGSHAGISVGPDGATHQMLEDIAIMRVLPNMIVIAPGDSVEAEKATLALASDKRPAYMRLAREKTPIITTTQTPFEIGKAYVFHQGVDVTILATGTLTYHALIAAEQLAKDKILAEVIHAPTIKPLDNGTILESVRKTKCVVTAEEGQKAGGLGGAVAEFLSSEFPVPIKRIGMKDRFGESGQPNELLIHFGLDANHIRLAAHEVTEMKKRFIADNH